MPFLDTNITLSPHGLRSSVYRKRTNTDVVLHYKAMAPMAWKTELTKCLLHRAEVVCSDTESFEKEITKLKEIFFENGYPTQFFDKITCEYLEKRRRLQGKPTPNDRVAPTKRESNVKESAPSKSILKIPYVGKASITYGKRMQRLLKPMNEDIRVVF